MAVTQQNILMAALDTLTIDSIDVGGTFRPLIVSAEITATDIPVESFLTPVDSEIISRLFSASVEFAELSLVNIAIVWNIPASNIVSSSLTMDYGDRGLLTWVAVGKSGSSPASGERTFNFPRSRAVGTFPVNLAKLEPTNLPVEFRFYADRTTGIAGTVTDTESVFMAYDTARSSQIDLGGGAVSESIYTAVDALSISLIRVIYDEATSADAGVAVRIGKIGDADFFATFTTEINKAAGTVTIVSPSTTTLAANTTLTVECDGGKTGTGAISIQIELEA